MAHELGAADLPLHEASPSLSGAVAHAPRPATASRPQDVKWGIQIPQAATLQRSNAGSQYRNACAPKAEANDINGLADRHNLLVLT
jgi:hypothetical protein